LQEIQALARGLKVLSLLIAADNEVGITEIAEYLNIDKSSASRLAHTLAQYGYAEQDAVTRRFRPGAELVLLSHRFWNRIPLRVQSKPFLRHLVDETGEAAHVAILVQGEAFFIEEVESPAALRVDGGLGRYPLHCTAVGKSLLAFANAPLPAKLDTFTARTITSPAQLRLHLEQVRFQKYALDDEEFLVGVRCLAAPVYDYSGEAVATIGISGPITRLTMEQVPPFAHIVMNVAASLSQHLGYTVPASDKSA
jgi:DNA-binding IclR family transcriptional regulator